MTVKGIYEKLLLVRRPIDFFGEIESVKELHSIYRKYSKAIHPDIVLEDERYYANEAFLMLHHLYIRAINEYDNGVYFKMSEDEEYKKSLPIFQINFGDKRYEFYKNLYVGEVAEIYEGVCNKNPVCIKIPISNEDSDLIGKEYELLSKLRHQSLPYVEDKFIINGVRCFAMRKIEGIRAEELLNQYPSGVPAEHVLWMIERLLSVVGFLHIHKVVHGNIKPDNIIINKQNHNVTLTGFSFAIVDANKKNAKYKIVNDYYTANEVGKDTRVEPSTDIYSIGKIAIYLLGGDVKSNSIPSNVEPKISKFIYYMTSDCPDSRPNDAWRLYKDLQALRTELFGTERFKKLD